MQTATIPTDTVTPRERLQGWTQSARSLALYRIIYAFAILWGWGRASYVHLADIPSELYHPPLGPFMLLPGWPAAGLIVAVQVAYTFGLVALLFGSWTRVASLVVAATALFGAGLGSATGKIDHNILVFVAIPAVMAFTSWGDTWSVDAGRARVRARPGFRAPSRRAVQVFALLVAMKLGTSGVAKAATGWLALDSSAGRGWLRQYANLPRLGEFLVDVSFAPLWLGLDVGTVLVEMGLLVAVWRRRWFVRYLPVLLGLHLSIVSIFGINFGALLVVYLAFVRLDGLADRLAPTLDGIERLLSHTWRALLAVAAIGWLFTDQLLTAGHVPALIGLARRAGVPLSGRTLWGLALVGALWCWRRSAPRETDDRMPGWLYGGAIGVLVVQVTLLLTFSEPFPAPTGPLFMGSPDRGGETIQFRQTFHLRDAFGNATRVHHSDVLPTPESNQLRRVRFPTPPLGPDARPTDDPAWFDDRRWQGHRFTSVHLGGYGGELSDAELAWVRRGLVDGGHTCLQGCELVVRWQRLSIDTDTGARGEREPLSEEVHPLGDMIVGIDGRARPLELDLRGRRS